MLTDVQVRAGVIDPVRRWPNGVVPYVIDGVFSEYCSTTLQFDMRGVEGNFHSL